MFVVSLKLQRVLTRRVELARACWRPSERRVVPSHSPCHIGSKRVKEGHRGPKRVKEGQRGSKRVTEVEFRTVVFRRPRRDSRFAGEVVVVVVRVEYESSTGPVRVQYG